MAIHVAYPHIEKPLDAAAHLKRLPRIRVAQIVIDYLAHGWSPDEMCRMHSHLTPAEAHAAMLYYFDHREEIDQEIQSELDQVDEERKTSGQSSLALRLCAQGLLK